jgi:replication-associated recombination protein RarA
MKQHNTRQALVAKYEPERLDDFIGVAAPKAVLARLIEDPYESAFLLTGPSGTGKTTMALVAAKAIGGKLHHISAAKCTVEALERLVSDCQYAPMGGGRWHVAVIDEADSISAQAQKAFLSILDTAAMPRDTIFLMTSNETRLLHPRFLSRLRRLDFTPPVADEQAAFLARIWKREKGGKKQPDCAAIVRAAGGNIRSALMTLETELLVPGTFVEPAAPPPAPATRRPRQAVTVISKTDYCPRQVSNERAALKARAVEMFTQGKPLAEIAAALSTPHSTIWRWTRTSTAA